MRRILVAVAVTLVSTGCATQTPTKPHRSTSTTTTAPTRTQATTTARPATISPVSSLVTKALVVFIENHTLAEMQADMPYLNGLAQRYGYAADYTASTHPSLPNYLSVAAGSTFGITDDADPSAHLLTGATVFGQALQVGDSAKVYAESEPSNCYPTSSGMYAVRHTAWPYFVDEAAACKANQPPSGSASGGAFSADAASGSLPTVGWLIPNLCNDAHDCSLATADNWLATMLPDVFNGPDWSSGRLAVVITADEDDRSSNNTVLTVVVHPSLSGKVVTSTLNHYSLSAFFSAMSGSAPLRDAASAPSFAEAFGLTTR